MINAKAKPIKDDGGAKGILSKTSLRHCVATVLDYVFALMILAILNGKQRLLLNRSANGAKMLTKGVGSIHSTAS
jgi:hypothetical protein